MKKIELELKRIELKQSYYYRYFEGKNVILIMNSLLSLNRRVRNFSIERIVKLRYYEYVHKKLLKIT